MVLGGVTVRLFCLNAWGGKLHDQLLPYLAALQPDVLCLQEVIHTPTARTDWLTYRDDGADLPQRANLFSELAAALPDHTAIFCPAAIGDLWDGQLRYASQWGLATYVRKLFPIIAQHQGFVHGAFSANGYGAHPRSRTGHAVRVLLPGQGQKVTIAHMHGLRDPAGKADTPARHAQAQRFRALVQSIAFPADTLVLCGDFNVRPDSQTFDILGTLGVMDLVTARGFDGTRTTHYTKPQRFADYMLVSPDLHDAQFDVIRAPEVSDHCPLLLRIA